jgi:hypothetical protein
LDQSELEDELTFLDEVEKDNASTAEKCEVVVLRLLDKGRRLVRRLAKFGKD